MTWPAISLAEHALVASEPLLRGRMEMSTLGTVVALLTVGLCLAIRCKSQAARGIGVLAVTSGLVVLGMFLPTFSGVAEQLVFWLLASLTLAFAVATILAHSPVHAAICFAVTLLGTGSLMLLEGAQFLGIATVAVYAGAIVVTFLFVLMLSQPGGSAHYDRISWGPIPVFLAALAGSIVVAGVAWGTKSLSSIPQYQLRQEVISTLEQAEVEADLGIDGQQVRDARLTIDGGTERVLVLQWAAELGEREHIELLRPVLKERLNESVAQLLKKPAELQIVFEDVRSAAHVASLGNQLFTKHLVGVQVAGTLLLVALVGAVAIIMQSKQVSSDSRMEANA